MAELRCHACGTAVTPSAIYCSTCGQLRKRTPPSWFLDGWRGFVQIIRILFVLWLAGFIVQVAVPVALRITPVCGTTPSMIAVIPRTLGLIDSQQGVVGGQPLLQAGDCHPVASPLYSITTNQDIWFAAAQRDPHTWVGWLVVTSETNSAAVTQIGVRGMRDAINLVWRGYQWVIDNCIGVSC